MRIGLLIRDTDYRDALVEKLSSNDNDIFVNVLDGTNQSASDCLVLTDADPENLDYETFERIRDRTVFLSNTNASNSIGNRSEDLKHSGTENCHRVFKYTPVYEMLSEISLIYNEWRGNGLIRNHTTRTIAVVCEYDLYSSDRSRALARQIIYRHGGRVLVFSLSYLNDYGLSDNDGINRFARLMYEARSGRLASLDKHAYTDAYGVSYLLLSPGLNPAAYLELEELNMLISGLSANYDTVILDVGTCFRKENILLLKNTDVILYFKNDRRQIGLSEMLGRDALSRVKELKISGDSDEAMDMDECVREMYGIITDEQD